MNGLIMVGLTHRTAPLSLLEQLSLDAGARQALLGSLRRAGYSEAAVLSTCSRVELYGVLDGTTARLPRGLVTVLAEASGCSRALLVRSAERRVGLAAAEHLCRVAAGLESRVLGELDVLTQVRGAFREAEQSGSAGPVLRRAFSASLMAGRSVRDGTTLGARGRSVAHRAVDVGLEAVQDTPLRTVLVVGSGRMATSAVDHLTRRGVRPLVTARDPGAAARLAGAGRSWPWEDLARGMGLSDLVVCATSSSHPVVSVADVRAAMAGRLNRGLTLVDVSVPRNVDPAAAHVAGVRLVDLEGVGEATVDDPELAGALEAGNAIVTQVVSRYADAVAAGQAGPLIASLREGVERTVLTELRRGLTGCEVPAEELDRVAHAIAGKLLHRPTLAAREAAVAGDGTTLKALCDLFGVPTT